MGNRLPMFVVLFLLAGALLAQENPDPRQNYGDLTQSDFRALLSRAESGDRETQYRLALSYSHENGTVPSNDAASREWMLRSAEQGYAPAQVRIGMMFLGATGDFGKADLWLRRAAEQGNAEGQFWLGASYEQGWFGNTNPPEALKWLRNVLD